MKTRLRLPILTVLAALAATFFTPSAYALTIGDSESIAQLLKESKIEAIELKRDAEDMESFAASQLTWDSLAAKITMVKEHIQNSGKLLASLDKLAPSGSPWQRIAIQQINPLLRELAGNTEATIRYMNNHRTAVHTAAFREIVKANYDLAADLETMIRNAVDYGEMKERFDGLTRELEPRH